ncbi:MAG: hypothetical protein IT537_03255 [Hyphomicrobiales bacterium]|nr:hypothetical protein [Hyphomicrobiales bacterium]
MLRILALLAALVLIAPAAGQDSVTVPGAPTTIGRGGQGVDYPPGTGGGPPPTCSNSLDLSDPCNSQYIGAL